MGAVVLVVRLAVFALQAGPNLSTDTNAVSNLHRGDLVTDLDSLADDLVSDAERETGLAPSTYRYLSDGQR